MKTDICVQIFLVVIIIYLLAKKLYKRKRCNENFDSKNCVVNQMDEELYKFATKRNCTEKDCALCDLKYRDEEDVVNKINTKQNTSKCIVSKMENEVNDYVKTIMII